MVISSYYSNIISTNCQTCGDVLDFTTEHICKNHSTRQRDTVQSYQFNQQTREVTATPYLQKQVLPSQGIYMLENIHASIGFF